MQSYWMDDLPSAADVVIVGAGMTGLATAYYLAQRGMECVVLERERVAAGASGRNAGILITGLGEHYARSIAGMGRERARQVWEINRDNHRLLREVLATEGIACDYARTGSFAMAWDDREAEDLEASLAPMGEDGFPAEWLDAAQLRRELGGVRSGRVLYVPEDAQLHPVKMLRGLGQSVARRGAAIHEQTLVRGFRRDGEGWVVETADGELFCRRVVVATNAYTPLLLDAFRGRIEPVRGQCLAAELPGGAAVPGPCYTDRGHVYWRAHGNRLILGGFDRLSPETERTCEEGTTAVIQTALEEFAAALFPGRTMRVTHRWSGIMGYGRDWFPYLGEIEPGAGMYVAAGFTGHGFGYCFQAAQWIAGLIDGTFPAIPAFLSVTR